MRRVANVSVDLDGLRCYHEIHSIGQVADPLAIYTVALPRFLELFEETGVRATFFVIAADLEHEKIAAAARRIRDAGHEVASHTYRHAYTCVTGRAAASPRRSTKPSAASGTPSANGHTDSARPATTSTTTSCTSSPSGDTATTRASSPARPTTRPRRS